MKKLVDAIHANIKIKRKFYTIDNGIFKMHYRVTTLMLMLMTLIITSQELIGEHIKCMGDKGVPEPIMNRFCFFTSTFTTVKYLNKSMMNSLEVAHPGVGPMGLTSDEPVKHHAYYQWVPFVLFFQGILFYIPHLIWKDKEGGRMKKLVLGLENAAFAYDKPLKIGGQDVPDKISVQKQFSTLRHCFMNRIVVNRGWTVWLIFCELLNLGNLILNIMLVDAFLNGHFWTLGHKLVQDGLDASVDIFDIVFPKITKCTFHKYGPSGGLQAHDAMCVMALNIINEKVYAILWFWFMFLLAATTLGIIWRMLTFCLYSRSIVFNKIVFSVASSFSPLNQWALAKIISHCNYMDWLFLVYLAKNMDHLVFANFIRHLVSEFRVDNYEDYIVDGPEKGLIEPSEKYNYYAEITKDK